jgi:hypothetical protein
MDSSVIDEEFDVTDTPDRTSSASGSRHPGSPEGKVIGAVNPSAIETVTAALVAAGFATDQIDVVTSDEIDELDIPINRPGLTGLVNRFLFSMGDELDEIERARQELAAGQVLVGVPVGSDEAMHRAGKIMRDNGSHWVTHFGRSTITSLE